MDSHIFLPCVGSWLGKWLYHKWIHISSCPVWEAGWESGCITNGFTYLRAMCGKLIEKVAVSQMDSHMTDHNLHEIYQSACRAHYSTESTLLKVSNDVLTAIDQRKCVLLTLMDLSATFDMVGHNRFLDRFESAFGVTRMAQEWLESYFMERHQAIHINSSSVCFHWQLAYHKGQWLAHLLQTLHKAYLCNCCKAWCHHTLYVSCDPEDNVYVLHGSLHWGYPSVDVCKSLETT